MITKRTYIIQHILNNSSVIVDDTLTEQILMGKGIGFGRKVGEILPKGVPYEKSYRLLAQAHDFQRIINGYDEQVVVMVMDTIEQIIKRKTSDFTTHDLVTLADHLAAMFGRILNEEAIISFFAQETKTLYPQAFAEAGQIADIIVAQHAVNIPEAEIAYIALYLHNMESVKSKQEIAQMTAIISQMNDLFKQRNEYNIDKNSLAYSRLLIHIHLLIAPSQFKKRALSSAINNAILTTYTSYRDVAGAILKIIEQETQQQFHEAEVVYLVIHLVNLFEPQSVLV